MDVCINLSCTNVIYKHIHHGEYTNMYIMLKCCQNIFFDKNGKEDMMTWCIIPHHINLGPCISMSILSYFTKNLVNLGNGKRQDL